MASLIRNRDLTKLTADPKDDVKDIIKDGEKDVKDDAKAESKMNNFYTLGQDIMQVQMESPQDQGRALPVLPPLDLHLLQTKLTGGRLPPGYGARDQYGCTKVVVCLLCSTRLQGEHQAVLQVQGSL